MADYKLKYTGEQVDSAIEISTQVANGTCQYQYNDVEFIVPSWENSITLPCGLAKYATSLEGQYSDIKLKDLIGGGIAHKPVHLSSALSIGSKWVNYWFSDSEIASELYIPKMHWINGLFAFTHSKFTKILTEDGTSVTSDGLYSDLLFGNCPNLVEIGTFDATNWNGMEIIYNSPKVKSIHCKHWRKSFNISASSCFEQDDLVEIISNLDEVTSVQTLTMGATNLAKLTEEQIKVATDKGWVLA